MVIIEYEPPDFIGYRSDELPVVVQRIAEPLIPHQARYVLVDTAGVAGDEAEPVVQVVAYVIVKVDTEEGERMTWSYKCGHKSNAIFMKNDAVSYCAYITWREEQLDSKKMELCFPCWLKKNKMVKKVKG